MTSTSWRLPHFHDKNPLFGDESHIFMAKATFSWQEAIFLAESHFFGQAICGIFLKFELKVLKPKIIIKIYCMMHFLFLIYMYTYIMCFRRCSEINHLSSVIWLYNGSVICVETRLTVYPLWGQISIINA